MSNAASGPFRDLSRSAALSLVAFAYLAATIAAMSIFLLPWPGLSSTPLIAAASGDIIATIVIFIFSLWLRNSSMYDAYWSVAPIIIVAYWCGVADAAPLTRKAVVLALVVWWGVRLTYNWARGWTGFGHEDWRYVNIRDQTGIFYWPVSFLGIHLFPTVQVFLGLVPVWYALQSPHSFGPMDFIACLVTGTGIWWEMTADKQLHVYSTTRKVPGETFSEGLWKYCRHPNYFGEMSFWVGLAGFAVAAGVTHWWAYVGAIAIIIMFNLVSLPMIDKRMMERRPDYAEHMRKTSRFIPLPPRS